MDDLVYVCSVPGCEALTFATVGELIKHTAEKHDAQSDGDADA